MRGEEPSGTESTDDMDTRGWGLALLVRAASSMMTEGTLPLVYAAVNSHGRLDTRQRAQGQRPVQRVFFLHRVSVRTLHYV